MVPDPVKVPGRMEGPAHRTYQLWQQLCAVCRSEFSPPGDTGLAQSA